MLYATGGLVLGESMALILTAEQKFLGLAAVLLVFGCAVLRMWTGDGGPALFALKKRLFGVRLAILLTFLGFLLGIFFMEREEGKFLEEERRFLERKGMDSILAGRILEIGETANGYRLMLGKTEFWEEGGKTRRTAARKAYCYLEEIQGLKVGMKILAEGETEAAEPARNPGGFHFRNYCRSFGVGGLIYGDRFKITDQSWSLLPEALRMLRGRLSEQMGRIAEETDGGILCAVLLGDKTNLEDSVYEMYQKNGISHLLAISGLHVSVIGMGLWKGLRKCGLGYGSSGLLAGGILFCYGIMTGFGTSVVRAVTMMMFSFLASYLGRTYDMPSALCVPAMFFLIQRPFLLTQAGFQLSFLAVAAICFPGRFLIGAFGLKGFSQTVLISLSIQLVTAPAVLYHSFELPLHGIFLNLLVIPLMSLVVVSGLLGLGSSFLWEPAGMLFLGGAHYVLGFYEILCRIAGEIFWPTVLGRPGLGQIAAYYMVLAAGIFLAWRKASKEEQDLGNRSFVSWMIFSAGVLFSFFCLLPIPSPGLSVTFLDVGQGDGIYLECEGRRLLVDCGSSQQRKLGEDCLVPFLKSRGAVSLDGIVITHGDSDHINGIRYLLEEGAGEISIGFLAMPLAGKGEEIYEELEQAAESCGIVVLYLKTGDRLDGLLGEKAKLLCHYPEEGQGRGDRNEQSLVFSLRYGNFRLLLTGDAESGGEREMLKRDGKDAENLGNLAPVTVLKAGHHGSDSSTGEEFLAVLRPEHVIFSYGEGNRYGHPSPAVLERVERIGAERWETARQGAITVETDGRSMEISGFLTSEPGFGMVGA